MNLYIFILYKHLGGQTPNVSSVGTPVSSNTCSTPVSKSMITNASFRTKKLPGNNINYYFSKIYLTQNRPKLGDHLNTHGECLRLFIK